MNARIMNLRIKGTKTTMDIVCGDDSNKTLTIKRGSLNLREYDSLEIDFDEEVLSMKGEEKQVSFKVVA